MEKRRSTVRRLLCLAVALVVAMPLARAGTLAPRLAPEKPSLAAMEAIRTSGEVVVKFAEGSGVRIRGDRVFGLAAAEQAALREALAAFGLGVASLTRLHDEVPEATLDRQRGAAEKARGRRLADLNLYYVLTAPAGTKPAAVAARLNALPFVELAEPAPAPPPPPVATPSFVREQGYRRPGRGVGALAPARHPGGYGRGVTVVDVEYSWQLNHEDLRIPASARIDANGKPFDPFYDTNHGTAVLGILFGIRNSYGVTGLVPKATPRVASVYGARGYSVARAVTRAATLLQPGDVILIEQQAAVCGGDCEGGAGCGPVEWNQPEYDSIATATGLGIVVVEAAGNGSVDLDAPACRGRFDRTRRDSGAIIVGAGAPETREKLAFSSYGSRVDVQGWGREVWTTGYGTAFDPGSVRRLYASDFSGTSSASPIVAGTVAAVQGALKASGRRAATPKEMRSALVATGLRQRGPHHIGPLPQAVEALRRLKRRIRPTAGAATTPQVEAALAAAE